MLHLKEEGYADGGIPYSEGELALMNNDEALKGNFPICVEDFCGTDAGFHIEYWADYDPIRKVTVFGGDWEGIPDMPSAEVPTAAQAHLWVKAHQFLQKED